MSLANTATAAKVKKAPAVLAGPVSLDKMQAGGLGTASESRSQEVAARLGLGFYGLGWLRRFAVSIPQETR